MIELERAGRLAATVDERGVHWHDRAAVEALAIEREAQPDSPPAPRPRRRAPDIVADADPQLAGATLLVRQSHEHNEMLLRTCLDTMTRALAIVAEQNKVIGSRNVELEVAAIAAKRERDEAIAQVNDLPDGADIDHVTSELRDGVLTVSPP